MIIKLVESVLTEAEDDYEEYDRNTDDDSDQDRDEFDETDTPNSKPEEFKKFSYENDRYNWEQALDGAKSHESNILQIWKATSFDGEGVWFIVDIDSGDIFDGPFEDEDEARKSFDSIMDPFAETEPKPEPESKEEYKDDTEYSEDDFSDLDPDSDEFLDLVSGNYKSNTKKAPAAKTEEEPASEEEDDEDEADDKDDFDFEADDFDLDEDDSEEEE